jgi:peptide/nickel transport system substrate-binding protein
MRTALLTGALAALLATAGCGSDDDGPVAGSGAPRAVGGGGVLGFALSDLPEAVDPLEAVSRPAQILARQAYEPLVARMRPPYDSAPAQAGLASEVTPSADRSAWSVQLRPGVSFQDGTPLDAEAVLANARRWASTSQGGALLPGLFAADTPRPGVVRFLFEGSRPDAERLLASPRLGIVSPRVFEPQSGEAARVKAGATAAGSGPFRLGVASVERLELSRFEDWWGSPLGLGPALDSVVFLRAPNGLERLRLLGGGQVQATEPVGAAGVRLAEENPLLRVSGGAGGVGYSASVRGLGVPPAIPQLSAVWRTTIGS